MKAKLSARRAKWGFWACIASLLLAFSYTTAADALTDYRLDCMGCHLADGSGAPGRVPDMRGTLAVLVSTEAGRQYLVQIPGSAQAPLSDRELARLLNWMVQQLSAPPSSRTSG